MIKKNLSFGKYIIKVLNYKIIRIRKFFKCKSS